MKIVKGRVSRNTLTFGILLRANMGQLTYGPYERLPVRFNSKPASTHNLREDKRNVGCKYRLKVIRVRHALLPYIEPCLHLVPTS
jgi:hypothetical protein